MSKLDVKAFGLAVGIVWAAGVLVMGLIAMVCPWGARFVDWLAPFYVGYDATIVGILIGAIWGFIDGGIGAVLIAWLYNKFAK